jgi:Phage tail lysozyme
MRFYTHDLHIPKEVAAGMVGNLYVETAGFTKFHEMGLPWSKGGIGDPQWTGRPRRIPYEMWAKDAGADPSKLNTIEQYHAIELQKMGLLDKLQKAKTTQEGSDIFLHDYEGTPRGTAHADRRLAAAEETAGRPPAHHTGSHHRHHHHRHGHGRHPALAGLEHKRPEVEITMDGPGSWTVS